MDLKNLEYPEIQKDFFLDQLLHGFEDDIVLKSTAEMLDSLHHIFLCCFFLGVIWSYNDLHGSMGRMRRQPKKSRSTAIPHHGVHIVTRPSYPALRRDLRINCCSLILLEKIPALQRRVFSKCFLGRCGVLGRNQRFLEESLCYLLSVGKTYSSLLPCDFLFGV